MHKWLIKAAVQGVIARMPHGRKINDKLHKLTGRDDLRDAKVDVKLDQTTRHLEYFRAVTGRHKPEAVLEIGTGWEPFFPLSLYLCGIPQVLTLDKEPLLVPVRVRDTARRFLDYADSGRLTTLLPDTDETRLRDIRAMVERPDGPSGAEMLESLGIRVLVCDARSTPLPSSSVDLVVSNFTLEHIPTDILRGIFEEMKRIAAPGAVMSHCIDAADHYAHTDRSISKFNFYKYSDRVWRLFNNPLNWVNRMTVGDYRRLLDELELPTVYEHIRQGPVEDLDRIRPAPRFRGYSREDLLPSMGWLVSEIRGPGT